MEAGGTALVTGAGRGIGRAVALELQRRGFEVVATMRDVAAGKDLDGMRVQFLDVNEPETMELPSELTVLVNNAGVESDNLPLEMMPSAAWRMLFETNVFGLIEVTKRAVPIMRANGGGVICNITEVAQFGIRVVEVMPGPIETDMLATSDRPAAAIAHERYRALAEKMWAGRQAIRSQYTPADEAARRVVDAICDDDGPLRYGCDDLSEGMLAGWNTTDNARWVRGMLRGFVE